MQDIAYLSNPCQNTGQSRPPELQSLSATTHSESPQVAMISSSSCHGLFNDDALRRSWELLPGQNAWQKALW